MKKLQDSRLPDVQSIRKQVNENMNKEPVVWQKKGSDLTRRQFCCKAADEPVAKALNWMVLAGTSAH